MEPNARPTEGRTSHRPPRASPRVSTVSSRESFYDASHDSGVSHQGIDWPQIAPGVDRARIVWFEVERFSEGIQGEVSSGNAIAPQENLTGAMLLF